MDAYIYNIDTKEILAIITGESNKVCEAKAEELNYMGSNEYGICYMDNELTETNDTEYYMVKQGGDNEH